jgi:hypothetical protein
MLDDRQKKAARLVAWVGARPYVAEQVGVGPKTITRWKQLPEFVADGGRLRPERDAHANIGPCSRKL